MGAFLLRIARITEIFTTFAGKNNQNQSKNEKTITYPITVCHDDGMGRQCD
jgi:hypothetical protein